MSSGKFLCERCGKDITISGSKMCRMCDPNIDAIIERGQESKSPHLCAECHELHLQEHLEELKKLPLEEVMGVIRFITAPNGGAPLDVRQKWVGVEVPCLYRDPHDSGMADVVTKNYVAPYDAYVVPASEALKALELAHPGMAEVWRGMGYSIDNPNLMFSFNVESAEVLKYVLTKEEFDMRL